MSNTEPGLLSSEEMHRMQRRMASSLRGDLGWTNDSLIERVADQMARVGWSMALVWLTECLGDPETQRIEIDNARLRVLIEHSKLTEAYIWCRDVQEGERG